jgi:hypothetical protein
MPRRILAVLTILATGGALPAAYSNKNSRQPEVTTEVPRVEFVWEMRSPDLEKIRPENFRALFSGVIRPPVTGSYTLRLNSQKPIDG